MKVKRQHRISIQKSFAIVLAFLIAFTTVSGNLQSYAASNDLIVEFKERLSNDGQSVHLDIYVKEEEGILLKDIVLPNGERRSKQEMQVDEGNQRLYTTVELNENKKYDFVFNYNKTTNEKDKEEIGGVLKSSYEVKSIQKGTKQVMNSMDVNESRATIPNPRQTVKGPDGKEGADIAIDKLTGEITFTVKQFIAPDANHPWKNFGLRTTLPKEVQFLSLEISDDTGYDILEEFQISGNISNKNIVIVDVNNDFFLNSPDFQGHEITFKLRAQLAKDLDPNKSYVIKNDAEILANGQTLKANSSTATYTAATVEEPLENPTISISDANESIVQSNTLDSRKEELTYKVTQKIPASSNWSIFEITDELSTNYEIQSVKVMQDESTDVSSKFAITKLNNKVQASASTEFLKSSDFYKHSYTLEMKVKIKDQLDITTVLTINNDALVNRNNDIKKTSVTKTVYIPPTKASAGKQSVSDIDEADVTSITLSSRSEKILFKTKQQIPNYHVDQTWDQFLFTNTLDSALSLNSIKVKNEQGVDVTNQFKNESLGQNIILKASPELLKSNEFYGRTFSFELESSIKESYPIKQALTIENVVVMGLGSEMLPTNKVKVQYTPSIVVVSDPTKTVSDKDESMKIENTLASRDEKLTYRIVQKTGDYALQQTWDSFVVKDQLHESLQVESIKIENNKAEDVSGLFKIDQKDNNISVTALDTTLVSKAFYNQEYTVEIVASIKKDYVIKDQLIFNNQASVSVNDSVKNTNKVTTTYTPYGNPDQPVKTVSDARVNNVDNNQLESKEEEFTYRITQAIPKYHPDKVWKSFEFNDTISDELQVQSVKVLEASGKDVSNQFKNESSLNQIHLVANKEWMNETSFYNTSYTFEIVVKIKADIETTSDIDIENKASLNLDGDTKETNAVHTKYSATELIQKPIKRVSDKDETLVTTNVLQSRKENLVYTIEQKAPLYHKDAIWDSFIVEDNLQSFLNVKQVKVVSDEGLDVSSKFTNESSENKIKLVASKELLMSEDFYGHTYSIVLTTQIKDDYQIDKDITFDNKATTIINKTSRETNRVQTSYKAIPKLEQPTKTVSDKDEFDVKSNTLASRHEEMKYNITQKVKEYHEDKIFTSFNLSDVLDNSLELTSYQVLQDGNDVSDKFMDETKGQVVSLVADKDWLQTKDFYNHKYEFILNVKVRDDAKLSGNTEVVNQATLLVDKDTLTTNTTTTSYTSPVSLSKPTKDIVLDNGTKVDTIVLDSNQQILTFEIKQNIQAFHEDAKVNAFVFEDQLDANLSIQDYKVFNGSNDVTSEFEDQSVGQTIHLVAKQSLLDQASFYNQNYVLKIQVKVNSTNDVSILNKASVTVNDQLQETNEVSIKYRAPVASCDPKKTVSDSDEQNALSNELKSKDEAFSYKITQSIAAYHKDAELSTFVVSDVLAENVKLIDIKIVDENNSNVSSKFTQEIADGNIKVMAKDAVLKDASFYGHSYSFIFNVKLKDDAIIEDTIEIRNIANVQLGEQNKKTNEVVTIYKGIKEEYKAPTKKIIDKDNNLVVSNELTSKKDKIQYRIQQEVPKYHVDHIWKNFEIRDNISGALDIISVKVVNNNNEDVSDQFTQTTGNDLKLVAKKDWLTTESFYNQTYTVLIDARLKDNVGEASFDPSDIVVKNVASSIQNEVMLDTKEVQTTYLPAQLAQAPSELISTTADQGIQAILLSKQDEFTYHVSQKVPAYHIDQVWSDFIFSTTINQGVEVQSFRVVDENNRDVSDKFVSNTTADTFVVNANNEWLATTEFYNHTYTLEVKAKLVGDSVPGDTIRLENQFNVTRNKIDAKTNKVYLSYTSPKAIEAPTLSVSDDDEINVVENTFETRQELTYRLSQTVNAYHPDAIWNNFVIKDEFAAELTLKAFKVIDEKGNNVTTNFVVEQTENKITLSAKDTWLTSKEFYGHTYIVELVTTLKDVAMGDGARITNQASTSINAIKLTTNEVISTYTPLKDNYALPTKTLRHNNIEVSDTTTSFNEEDHLAYVIRQKVNPYTIDTTWTTLEFKDVISKNFNVKSIKVFNESDIDVSSRFTNKSTGNELHVVANSDFLNEKDFYNHVYRMEVEVEVNDASKVNNQTIINTATVIRGQKDTAKTNEVSISFKYPSTTVDLCAHKNLQGSVLKGNDFEFILKDEDGKEYKVTNKEDGSITFKDILFTKEGLYKFTIKENKGNNSNIVYDENEIEITVNVIRSNDGSSLVPIVNYEKDKQQSNTFINIFKDEVVKPEEPNKPTNPKDTNNKQKETKNVKTGTTNKSIMIFSSLLIISTSTIVFKVKKKKED